MVRYDIAVTSDFPGGRFILLPGFSFGAHKVLDMGWGFGIVAAVI